MHVNREQVLRYRWQRQQLDTPETDTAARSVDSLAVLDLGIQHGQGNAGRVALLNRGISVCDAVEVTDDFSDPLALVWGIRGGPHFYRRADLAEVEQALCPVSERDAERRSAGAAKKVQQMLTGWADMAAAMWTACADPAGKGVVSGRLHQVLRDELQVDCRPCGVVHPHEQLFRLSALHGGIELEPGTNPPVLRRIPGWTPTPWATGSGSAGDPAAVPPRYQIARAYLRLLGPATPKDLSGYLDTTVTEAKTLWPSDAIEVDRAGEKAWILPEDADTLAQAQPADPERVLLLNGFDLFLAAKDRHLLADASRHKELWPVLGRPGALVAEGELLGTWRPKSSGKKLSIRADWWIRPTAQNLATAEAAAERLAEAGGQQFAGLVAP
ncbi:DNA glycosylase AlkZ-like family protein [Granulicoccus phenolivorans]|uniref:DNA glycosylase AlkZ-like family protein n=1 Tax=Granulicoccus phenolivorans TaxID=266854 RepID=UPI000413FD1B|nr:crosslink repair DNA glycosylase YcaQ family protein [Granulicoccus phenolivorans]